MSRAGFVWPSAAAAERAALFHAGNPAAERFVVRQATIEDLADGLRQYAPAIVVLPETGEAIAVPEPGRVLGLDGKVAAVSWKQVRAVWEAPEREKERRAFEKLPIPASAAAKVIERRMAKRVVARVVHFAAPPGSSFLAQLRAAGCVRRLALAFIAYALAYGLSVAAWFLAGRAAIGGRWDEGWFWGWAVLLAIVVPLQAASAWWQGWLAIAFGGLLKQRLLAGSLEIDTDEIRRQGSGQLLSRVIESEYLENLSLSGGTAALLSSVELAAAGAVLSLGAAPRATVPLFAAWIAIVLAAGWQYLRRRKEWAGRRSRLTERMVEKMNGHRTRIAQQQPAFWHDGEDVELTGYLRAAESMDRWQAWLAAVGPRGWLTLGMGAVAWQFATAGLAMEPIAISTGGVLLGCRALRHFVAGASQCAGAWQSWEMVRDLFTAAASAQGEAGQAAVAPSGKVMDVREIFYAYPGRACNALAGCSLEIRAGDRILLEGASGSGKSTFGAMLAGSRKPAGGLVLAGGIDLATAGAQAWRGLVATAPQYHENHILSATLLFNLTMSVPHPEAKDAREALAVCRELGLGPLLARMPAGLHEIVGETGWQLSQGERSRVFLARAILQGAPLVILDESFAALDPETLQVCLECVLRRAPSLMVIAHP